ncbi:MAG: hypothetical protein AAFU77_16640 [Myxococcota bacterium]
MPVVSETRTVSTWLDSDEGRLSLPPTRLVWTARNWNALWQHWFFHDGAPYLGPFLLGRRAKDAPRYEIVDGSQRALVIALTLCALRDLLEHERQRICRSLVIAEFGAPLTGRLIHPLEPDSAALHQLLVDEGDGGQRSRLLSAHRAMRRTLARRLSESANPGELRERLSQRALAAELTLSVLDDGADLDSARRLHASHLSTHAKPSREKPRRRSGAAEDQWDLERHRNTRLPELTPEVTYSGTVWIPRILWALEWALRHGEGPQSASDIARTLHDHAFLAVANTNIARAFRHHRRDVECQRMWREVEPLRYEILSHGREVLMATLDLHP